MKTLSAIGIALPLFLASLSSNYAYAEIRTRQDADAFLNKYCIELVKTIEVQYGKQKVLAAEKRWEALLAKGRVISSIAKIYSNLCK